MARLDNLDYEVNGGTVNYEIVPEIAPLFNATTAYAAGDQVIHEGIRCKFTTAHPAGAWIGTDAEEMPTVAEELTSHDADITQLKADLTDIETALGTKAEIDGSYEDLTAGNAKQLESTQYVEDSEPYLHRTSGGSSDIGNREGVRAIVGGSVVWNQLVRNGHFSDVNPTYWAKSAASDTLEIADGIATLTIGDTPTNYYGHNFQTTLRTGISGHKYVAVACVKSTQDNVIMGITNSIPAGSLNRTVAPNTWTYIGYVYEITGTYSSLQIMPGYGYARYSEGDTIQAKSVFVADLTTMFPTTIADYIYSLEQSEVGSGIAWLRKHGYFTKDYYPQCEPDFRHVQGLVSHDMVEFNQWDEECEPGYYSVYNGNPLSSNVQIRTKNPIPVIPGATYYCRSQKGVWAFFYDADDVNLDVTVASSTAFRASLISNKTFTIPANARYMRFYLVQDYGTTYNHDICINLNWSGTHNGEYQPYEKHSYPLDPTVVLRGKLKLDANNNLYYDGDRYLPDGTVERNWHEVSSGDCTVGVYSGKRWKLTLPNSAPDRIGDPGSRPTDIMCSYPFTIRPKGSISDSTLYSLCFSDGSATRNFIFVLDASAITTVEEAQAWVTNHPFTLLYPVYSPSTETADPYQEVQICNDWGTEEYVIDSEIDVPVPVGHETRYPANLRDKLQHLPDLADSDGYYAIKQVGTQMSLEPFRIPKAPKTDGTYTLKATVTSGTPTYTWVDESQEVTEE